MKIERIEIALAEVMEKKGVKVSDVVEKTGLNEKTVRDLMKNKYERIGLNNVMVPLCNALDVLPAELLRVIPSAKK